MMKAILGGALWLLLIPVGTWCGPSRTDVIGRAAVLWKDPGDIAALDLFYGPGAPDRMPQGPFIFLKEDLKGTNPKFDVRDGNGIKWKVKLGIEARAEVAAARLVWAAGYFVQENYFFPRLQVKNMPGRLKRGREFIAPDGSINGARLKRIFGGVNKTGIWRWRRNPFSGSRELNGLRVMMALINNPDLKDANNGIYFESERDIYMVNDLGCSFSQRVWPYEFKGNLESYKKVGFIRRVGPGRVDFNMPIGPAAVDLAHLTWYGGRIWLRWIVRNIPRSDAGWMGQRLAGLSREQIQDAFRAAGYSSGDVQGFTDEILKRIAALNAL